jgi:asparagine synthetase B (glutamine-hydrolysing)
LPTTLVAMNDTSLRAVDALDAALWQATHEIRADVLLLGGGVDSALIAAMWHKQGHRFRAVTVGRSADFTCVPAHMLLPYPCNSDLDWSEKVARALELDWTPIALNRRDAMRYLDVLIAQQRSFDLGQLNNIALYVALDLAAGYDDRTTFATGDDGDGLFGGYLDADRHADWGAWVQQRIAHIDPPARGIGAALRWAPRFPYLHPTVLDVARSLTQADIRRSIPITELKLPPSFMDQFDLNAFDASERVWGKVVLRKVAERYLPHELAWRPKTDLQFGTGMCALEHPLAMLLNTGNRIAIEQTGIRFFNDAHRGLYTRFRGVGATIPTVRHGERPCPNCGAGGPIGKNHCHTCGHWEPGT